MQNSSKDDIFFPNTKDGHVHIPMLGKQKKCACGNEAFIEAVTVGRYLEELCQSKFNGTAIKDIKYCFYIIATLISNL